MRRQGHVTIKAVMLLGGFAASALSLPIAQAADALPKDAGFWGEVVRMLSSGSAQVVLAIVCLSFATAIVKQYVQGRQMVSEYVKDLKAQNEVLVKLVEKSTEATTKMSASADRLNTSVSVMELTSTRCGQVWADLGSLMKGMRERWDSVKHGESKDNGG